MTGLIVTEWIEPTGGAERVLDAIGSAFPDAAIRCLWNDAPERFEPGRVSESWLARTPLRHHKATALPFMDATWRSMGPGPVPDWTLVSSYVFAHHVRIIDREAPKYVYAHTPARYLWVPDLDPRGAAPVVRAAAPVLRRLDRRRAQEAAAIATNSRFVRERIARAWDRDAVVIHPPVAIDRIRSQGDWATRVLGSDELIVLDELPDVFVMGASRFTSYKRLDLVIAAADRAGVPAVIAGTGPDEARLRALAAAVAVPVRFVIAPSDALLFALIQRSAAFVFPPIEDFGIVPVEAQALGVPIVTGPVGGQIEGMIPDVSGVVVSSTTPADLARGIEKAMSLEPFDREFLAERYGEERFTREIQAFVQAGG